MVGFRAPKRLVSDNKSDDDDDDVEAGAHTPPPAAEPVIPTPTAVPSFPSTPSTPPCLSSTLPAVPSFPSVPIQPPGPSSTTPTRVTVSACVTASAASCTDAGADGCSSPSTSITPSNSARSRNQLMPDSNSVGMIRNANGSFHVKSTKIVTFSHPTFETFLTFAVVQILIYLAILTVHNFQNTSENLTSPAGLFREIFAS